MFKWFQDNLPVRVHVIALTVAIVIGLSSVLGTQLYSSARSILILESKEDVSFIAESRKNAIARMMLSAKTRAQSFGHETLHSCLINKAYDKHCITRRLQQFILDEKALWGAFTVANRKIRVGEETSFLPTWPPPVRGEMSSHFWRADEKNAAWWVYQFRSLDARFEIELGSDLSVINRILADRVGLGQTGEIFLVDSLGMPLTELRYQKRSNVSRIDSASFKLCLTDKAAQAIDFDYRNVSTVQAYVPAKDIGGGCMVALTEKSEILQPIYELRDETIRLAVISAIVALTLAILLSRFFTVPITRLTDWIVDGRKVGVVSHLRISGPKEVRVLSRSFLRMSREIAASQAALEQKAQELARSNSELEVFASCASHDLREPLRMVQSYLKLLREKNFEKLDKDSLEFLAFAIDGASRMSLLIEKLLNYSRVAYRQAPLEKVDLAQIVGNVLRALKLSIEETKATITMAPMPIVLGDKIQLFQLFQNLIENAIKYRREIPLKICIGAEKRDNYCVLSVSDNGKGIDLAEAKDQLFTMFRRFEPGANTPGSGIGLATCKKIVQRHGGTIWVESTPKVGTTFYFTLNLEQPSQS